MAAEQKFEVPDLDLPSSHFKGSISEPVSIDEEQSIYENTSIDLDDFDCSEIATDAPPQMPRVTHVDQAIFDAAAAPVPGGEPSTLPAIIPAISSTTRCPRCTMPIALHARTCPHCASFVMPIVAQAPVPTTFTSEPITVWSRLADVLATIPYGIWKRSAGYTFLIMVLGNACTCRKMSVGMNIVCGLVIALSFIGIGACVKAQRSP